MNQLFDKLIFEFLKHTQNKSKIMMEMKIQSLEHWQNFIAKIYHIFEKYAKNQKIRKNMQKIRKNKQRIKKNLLRTSGGSRPKPAEAGRSRRKPPEGAR